MMSVKNDDKFTMEKVREFIENRFFVGFDVSLRELQDLSFMLGRLSVNYSPTFKVVSDGDGCKFWCPFCWKWHHHGNSSGHRSPHCGKSANIGIPFPNGYYLGDIVAINGNEKRITAVPDWIHNELLDKVKK